MLTIGPTNLTTINRTVEVHHKGVQEAGPGTLVGISLRNISRLDIERGQIITDGINDAPVQNTESFTAQIKLINHSRGLIPKEGPFTI